jgi:hypothetical protein
LSCKEENKQTNKQTTTNKNQEEKKKPEDRKAENEAYFAFSSLYLVDISLQSFIG